ncbi:hypothetical protein [Rhodospirillum centenum]|uniref:Uncharacterized protein n=1 Tax=Rhodospirillum centenum (strain ATCC 51521 / SW) TaxID=414684 RepID=B6IPT8_RHOCS|nr:hypothetical protein [Rhodospirillum centenum]ACI97474.1 hypothetical protein RC1_0023 [Rhodospirillum centenum SW]
MEPDLPGEVLLGLAFVEEARPWRDCWPSLSVAGEVPRAGWG